MQGADTSKQQVLYTAFLTLGFMFVALLLLPLTIFGGAKGSTGGI